MKGKIALVTGASRGIGFSILQTLAEAGATVVGTATTPEGAARISEALAARGFIGRGLVLNVTDPMSVEQSLEAINSIEGAPTILVNNAAITQDNLMLRMKEEEWDQVINTNLTSVYHMTKVCLKGMLKKRWGRIINISSVVGSTGNAGQTNYAAAKAGLFGFTKSLAQEIGVRGITVNAVAPGFIDTDMTKSLSEEHKAILLSRIPLQRLGQPEDIAAAVQFLSSDAAAYITGHVLHVNGGMYMGG